MSEAPPPAAALLAQFERESASTRRMLERVPDGRFDWQPHPKSSTMGGLANHIVLLVGQAPMFLSTESRDVAAQRGQRPAPATTSAELLAALDRGIAASRAAIGAATEEQLAQIWTLRDGDRVLYSVPRLAAMTLGLFHLTHHRGQLSVYLRLNDIAVPGMYGPSADEH